MAKTYDQKLYNYLYKDDRKIIKYGAYIIYMFKSNITGGFSLVFLNDMYCSIINPSEASYSDYSYLINSLERFGSCSLMEILFTGDKIC